MPRKQSDLCAFGVGQSFLEIPSQRWGSVGRRGAGDRGVLGAGLGQAFLHRQGWGDYIGSLVRWRLWVISLVWRVTRNSWVSKTKPKTKRKTKPWETNLGFRFRCRRPKTNTVWVASLRQRIYKYLTSSNFTKTENDANPSVGPLGRGVCEWGSLKPKPRLVTVDQTLFGLLLLFTFLAK